MYSSRCILLTMNAFIKYKTPKQIEKEMISVEKGDVRTWGQIFMLLDSIDQSRYWQKGANSFTGWIEMNAPALHTKPAMLWRILSAGRFVRQVAERVKMKGIEIPPFDVLPDSVSPENVELLSKLSRVMPDETFADFARKVFSGDVKRSELRGAWETYRPVLMGKTARGRGVVPPKLNIRDAEQFRSLLEADTLSAFQAAGPGWTGIASPLIYRVFVHVDPEGYRRSPITNLFPAVVVVKPPHGPIEYHGIRFASFSRSHDSYKGILMYCDYLWIFNHKSQEGKIKTTSNDLCISLPDGIGILDISEGKVSVVRPAASVDGAGTMRGDIASALLVRSLGVK